MVVARSLPAPARRAPRAGRCLGTGSSGLAWGAGPERAGVHGQGWRSGTAGQWQGGDSREKRDQVSSQLSMGVHRYEPPHNGCAVVGEAKAILGGARTGFSGRAGDLHPCMGHGRPACAGASLGEEQRHRGAARGGRAQETSDGRTAARAQHSAGCGGEERSL